MRDMRWTRRQFLRTTVQAGMGVATLGVSGFVGYNWPRPAAATTQVESSPTPTPTPAIDVDRFVSRPDLQPPQLTVSHAPGTFRQAANGPRYLFLAPKGYSETGPGQQGVMIVDLQGRPIWLLPLPGANQVPMNVKVQTYRGQPVLTWWQGTIVNGHGQGAGLIYDGSYQQVATVQAGNGLQADLHEFLLTTQGTALLAAYDTVAADLSAIGGPSNGWVYAGVVQEVDIATGKVLFQWNSLDHIGVDETYQALAGQGNQQQPFDYLHLNSIDVAPDGDLVISARNTWALYKISRATGAIVWRLGGQKTDFDLDPDARFYWQHDARMLSDNQVSLFDDASSPPQEPQSRGLVLTLDTTAMRATMAHQYLHPAQLLADNQGSMQVLPDGRALVGWGAEPYVSEFSADGQLLFDARFPANDQSYRAFTADWVSKPVDKPAVVVGPNSARGVTVYVSWNGATEVKQWQILMGSTASSLAPAATVARSGFETAVAVGAAGPYFAAVALGANNEVLEQSDPVIAKQ